jgi:DNA repair protein RecN (Recombination protein N)
MLTLIRVANYAIIDEIEIELEPGFSIMTGETGAGKSILVDALGLALGDRADASAVRQGAERAEISVVFVCPPGHPALAWLAERGLDDGEACYLRRLVGTEGRSRAFVNNQPVTLTDLRELGGLLVDIHGQHAHQSLMNAGIQRRTLDAFGGLEEDARALAEAFAAWQTAESRRVDLEERSADREAQLDLLKFQLGELEELGLADGELETLKAERGRLANADRLLQGLDSALNQIYESDLGSAHSQAAQARRSLEGLLEHDASLRELTEQLGRAEIELREAALELMRYRDKLERDPERLEYVETRLDRIRRLARRHRVEEAELPQVRERLAAELAELDTASHSLEAVAAEAATRRKRYAELAERLSRERSLAARALSTEVSARLKELGMPHGQFLVQVEAKQKGDATGEDRIEFQVQINPGQPFGPIAKVASGGELSRISLALEVVATDASSIPTFIFDEVDAGIGGGVAEIVGRRLWQIANRRQVLCVTHLPQVASQGTHHYRVMKLTDGHTSRTQVRKLQGEERIEELSRMLGGVEITDATREHARDMIRRIRQP